MFRDEEISEEPIFDDQMIDFSDLLFPQQFGLDSLLDEPLFNPFDQVRL